MSKNGHTKRTRPPQPAAAAESKAPETAGAGFDPGYIKHRDYAHFMLDVTNTLSHLLDLRCEAELRKSKIADESVEVFKPKLLEIAREIEILRVWFEE
jgi:hypothetical protein